MKKDINLIAGLIAGLIGGALSIGLPTQAAVPDTTQSVLVQAPPYKAPSGSAPDRTEPVQETAPPEGPSGQTDGEPPPSETPQQPDEPSQDNPSAPTATSEPSELGEIVVTAERPRGSVIGDIPAERTFSPLEVRAFGVSNIGELIETLGPQVSSSRGREDIGPVTLLNGRRVSSFTEVSKIPTEAIERMDVFPESLALQYGFRADQKVVNIVTFERFSSQLGQLTYAFPTEGGRNNADVSASYFAIRGDTRFDFGADYDRSGSLLEGERAVQQPFGTPALGWFRTLLPETERFTLSGLVSGKVLEGVSSTLNGRFDTSGSENLLGRGAGGPLARDIETGTVQLGTTQSGRMRKWLWNFTGNYNRSTVETFTDVDDATGGGEEARSINTLANANLLLSGPVLELPAGPISTSVRGGVSARDFSSRSLLDGVTQRSEISRELGVIQANVDVPIAGRGREGTSWLGTLSANVTFEIERLSDFGTLRAFGYGLNWSPIEAISLIASATHEEGAPTVEQLGAPLVVTPNVRVFDFTRGEVADITRVFGGNPDLQSDDRRILSLGLNVKPFERTDLSFGIDYVATRIHDPIATFPIATPEIDAVFSERFTRDGDGRLLRIDGRPVNFARSDQEELRWGLNFTRPLGPTPPLPPGTQSGGTRFYASEAELRRKLPSGVQVVEVAPGSPTARRLENLSSRFFVSFYHTWQLKDEILVREGGPVLNLLDGGAIELRGGSRRHELELQAGVFKRGLGARLTANWQSGTDIRGSGGTTDDLRFSNLATVNINFFANLADQFGATSAPEWLNGTRATIGINNLFNSRPEVRDATGSTPLNYQAAYLDPLGRSVSFSLRKIF